MKTLEEVMQEELGRLNMLVIKQAYEIQVLQAKLDNYSQSANVKIALPKVETK